MDVTDYLSTYRLTARELAMKIILDVLESTGITATAGIGTNLFLCKVAMDIVAKHIPADKNGVRIAELDEMKFRRELWSHRPLTDFWRVGRGIAKKLEENGMFTMGDVALCSERNEDLAGSPPPLRPSRRTAPAPTVSAPVRSCTAPMRRTRQSWSSGR